jgi:hypothetical protein
MSTQPVEVPIGFQVGDWQVTELIGAGSWGTVYGARSAADGSEAALKFLPTGSVSPGEHQLIEEITRRELRFSRLADHPHLIRTFATERVSDPDAIVLVMERAEQSLADLLAHKEPPQDAERLLAQVCAGLAGMHRHGRIHGDLKPGNVLLMADGEVRLADFGLTTELDGTHAYTPPVGSIDYMPPEWWSERVGEQGVALRTTTDIWGFGVLAHQVLTGGLHPFPGATSRARSLAARAYAQGEERLRLDESLPAHWQALITDCLAPTHADRARHTADSLAERIPAAGNRPRRRVRPRVYALAAAGVVAAVTGGWLLLPEDAPKSTAAQPQRAGEIRADADVPEQYRTFINKAAGNCTEEEVTPALLAAMLKVESGFDAKASKPQTEEFGIAMWTPRVFNAWAIDGDGDGTKDHMSPADAIITMGHYVCWLDQRLKQFGLRENMPGMLAAAYRSSDRALRDAGGIPPQFQQHADAVLQNLRRYST